VSTKRRALEKLGFFLVFLMIGDCITASPISNSTLGDVIERSWYRFMFLIPQHRIYRKM